MQGQHGLDPLHASIPKCLDCLQHLKQSGLSFSSTEVHLIAISVCHPPVQSCSIFHPELSEFIKGLLHTYSLVKRTCSYLPLKAFRMLLTSSHSEDSLPSFQPEE